MSLTHRRGLTIVELLVAMGLSLVLIYGMVAAFARVGREASDGRAKIEMANQTRNVMQRLELDLAGATAAVRNWSNTSEGYFEAIEGSRTDRTDIGNALTQARLFGDVDDVLMLTTRSEGEPFKGKFMNVTFAGRALEIHQSPVAEVIYAVTPTGALSSDSDPRNSYLYRRALLVIPELNDADRNNDGTPDGHLRVHSGTLTQLTARFNQFVATNDISVRISLTAISGGGWRMRIIANSLEDLAARENRFGHRTVAFGGTALTDNVINTAFPHTIYTLSGGNLVYNTSFAQLFANSDSVMMSHAIAFDVKLYDPTAPMYLDVDGDAVMTPSDLGYYVTSQNSGTNAIVDLQNASSIVGRGAFVDIGYADMAHNQGTINNAELAMLRSTFSHPPVRPSPNGLRGLHHLADTYSTYTYDAWSDFYERNGLDDTGNGFIDTGNDQIDNNGTGGVDEFAEHEVRAPYGNSLRGIKVTVRLYESDTRQVRQMSNVTDFVPE